MVQHDVEPHLDVVGVRSRDQVGEFRRGIVGSGVLPVDRTEHERHVPPVVALVRVELVHRQQFEHRDAQRPQPGQLVDGRAERAGVGPIPPLGEAPDVRLVHHQWPTRALGGRGAGQGRATARGKVAMSAAPPFSSARREWPGGNHTSVAFGSSTGRTPSSRTT